jgi:pilus assembly protein Flp/PilA
VRLSITRRGLRSQSGQGLAEYALILGLVAVVAIVSMTLMGNNIDGMLSTLANAL